MCLYILKELEKQDGDVEHPTSEVFPLQLLRGTTVF